MISQRSHIFSVAGSASGSDVPVGLLNISLGGSPIESWMDIDTLRAFPEALAES